MKKILIVEDEYPVRDVLKIALSENGYIVYEAENGKQGVQMFIDCVPDIVLTDVKMPGISGIELTKKIKETQSDADVVIMTGYGSEELVIEAIRAGATNYVKKPVSFDELFNILDHIIFKRENRKRFEVIKEGVIYEKKTVIINNDIAKVWGIVNQVLYNIPAFIGERTIEGSLSARSSRERGFTDIHHAGHDAAAVRREGDNGGVGKSRKDVCLATS